MVFRLSGVCNDAPSCSPEHGQPFSRQSPLSVARSCSVQSRSPACAFEEVAMEIKITTTICGLYAMVILSGCSIAMALNGNKEPNFEHITVGAPKEEIDFEFNKSGTSKDLGDGKTEVTYKYEMGNSPNPARAAVYGYIDLATIGLAEPILTLIEFLQGHDEETRIVYGPDNKALKVVGYIPPPLSAEMKVAQEEQGKYIRKRPVPMP